MLECQKCFWNIKKIVNGKKNKFQMIKKYGILRMDFIE